jgi:hypothetical protein
MKDLLSEKACPTCISAFWEHHLAREMIQRLPELAPPMNYQRQPWCWDCSSALMVARLYPALDWNMARTAVGNDRREQYRLPGAPLPGLVNAGLVRKNAPGDLEDQYRWMREVLEPDVLHLELNEDGEYV